MTAPVLTFVSAREKQTGRPTASAEQVGGAQSKLSQGAGRGQSEASHLRKLKLTCCFHESKGKAAGQAGTKAC